MTYAVGLNLDAGLVFASDTRTNAGVDHLSTFKKMTVFETPGERVLVLIGAGNLSVTQSIVGQLRAWRTTPPLGRSSTARKNLSLDRATTMFEAARIVGAAVREVDALDGASLDAHGSAFNPTLILGGQIKGEPPRMFLIYAAGNFIESSDDTRYFQIGETKYGKPILDRLIHAQIGLETATKCTLISFDSTMRSNVSVGLPIDLLIYRRDSLANSFQRRLQRTDPYMMALSESWSEGLRQAFEALPDHDWLVPAAPPPAARRRR